MAIFPKSVNNELSNFFVENYTVCEEIKEALEKLKKELGDFVYYFDDLVTTLFFFSQIITENEKFQENFDRIKQCFAEYFIKQLEELCKSQKFIKHKKKILSIY